MSKRQKPIQIISLLSDDDEEDLRIQRNKKRLNNSNSPIILVDDDTPPVTITKQKQQQQSTTTALNSTSIQSNSHNKNIHTAPFKPQKSPQILKLQSVSGSSPQVTINQQQDRRSLLLQKLQQLQSTSSPVKSNSNSKQENDQNQNVKSPKKSPECSICMDDMTDMASTNCGHVFCYGCITDWLKKKSTCPLCNKKCNPKQIRKIFL